MTATIKLFEQGLADPRDCEYREVEIAISGLWGGLVAIMKTHAWVLPSQPNVSHRFVVAWNGLVYPALSIGDTANLKDDVLAAIESDEDARSKSANASPGHVYRFLFGSEEPQTASHSSLLPLKACLLLRLGENLLAEQVWAAWTAGMDRKADAFHLQDPYIMLARGWLWPRLHRAVCEHMRRDDRLALYDARLLNSLLYDITNVLEKRSTLWPEPYTNKYEVQVRDYFAFLRPVPVLFADQERRSKEKRVRWPLQSIVAKYDNPAERVAALILELDEATAYQRSEPGGVNMSEDAVVRELIKQGEAAVEPLLVVLEQDNRLTRSVRFHLGFSYHRHIISVYETAYDVLASILKISSKEEDADREDIRKGRRAVVAARLRTLWNNQRQGTNE